MAIHTTHWADRPSIETPTVSMAVLVVRVVRLARTFHDQLVTAACR
jgi:hypothetical protein